MTWRQGARRVVAVARRVRDEWPLATRGALLAGFSALAVFWYGREQLDVVLFLAGGVGLALVGLAVVMVLLAALAKRRRPGRPAPLLVHAETGVAARTGYTLPRLGRWPFLAFSCAWKEPEGVLVELEPAEGRMAEVVRAGRRGHAQRIVRRLSVEDVFGIAGVTWERAEASEVVVLPAVGRLRSVPLLASMAGGDAVPHPVGRPEGDRMDIRAYVPGDSVRHILWRAYARNRQVNVRVPERAIAPARRTVAYLLTGRGDEAAAGAARVTLEEGLLGSSWVFAADGAPDLAATVPDALQAVARSGTGEPRPGLGPFLEAALPDGQGRCIVFAPPRSGPWLDAALACARRFPGVLTFVIGTDGVAPAGGPGRLGRLVLAPVCEDATSPADLLRVLHALAGARCPAVVVDRALGRSYGADHMAALEAAAR